MEILNTMLPVFGVIALGALLAKIGFLTEALADGLNRIVYFVALPALLMRACAHAGVPSLLDWGPLAAVALPTLAGAVIAVVASRVLRLQGPTARAFVTTAFFGNLTYIGLPVIAHSLGIVKAFERPEILSATVVVLILMNILFNVATIGIFQPGGISFGPLIKRIATNPILLAGVAGLALASFKVPLLPPVEFTLASLGGMAIPGALLCIGSSLLRAKPCAQMVPVAVAVGIKALIIPLFCWLLLRGLELSSGDVRIALVLCACPTAVASYSLAREMRCDPEFVATVITASTLLSFLSLSLALAMSAP